MSRIPCFHRNDSSSLVGEAFHSHEVVVCRAHRAYSLPRTRNTVSDFVFVGDYLGVPIGRAANNANRVVDVINSQRCAGWELAAGTDQRETGIKKLRN